MKIHRRVHLATIISICYFNFISLASCGLKQSTGAANESGPVNPCDDRGALINWQWAGDPRCGPAADSRIVGLWQFESSEQKGCRFDLGSPKQDEIFMATIEFQKDKTCSVSDVSGTPRHCLWAVDWNERFISLELLDRNGARDSTDHYPFGVHYTFSAGSPDRFTMSRATECIFTKK